jgi:hypothetical protein
VGTIPFLALFVLRNKSNWFQTRSRGPLFLIMSSHFNLQEVQCQEVRSAVTLASHDHHKGTNCWKALVSESSQMRQQLVDQAEEAWRRGVTFGAAEAKNALASHGSSLTWAAAHVWINRCIDGRATEASLSNFERWERGCRIMFMLTVRRSLP